jgi:glycosyltransferase involved in cell wall biosynthesis
MKKVLILNTTLNKGGAARVAKDIFENLSTDFDITFAYGRDKTSSNEKTFFFGNTIETLMHVFLVRFFGLEGHGNYFSTRKLIKFIEKENFDLINIHNLHGYYVNFFTLLTFLEQKKIPVIYSVHDEWPITWLPAHSLGCIHCKTGAGTCTNTYSYPKNYFPIFTTYMLKKKRKIFNSLSKLKIICPSIWLTNSLTNSFLHAFEIKTIFNYINTSIFKPIENNKELRDKYQLPKDKKIILYIASNLNDRSKGIDKLKEVAHILRDKEYLFLTVGEGKIVGDNIKNLGYIHNKEKLAEIYALSDIFCFASSAETFLLTAAESMACGTPVVGFELPVVKELVDQSVGILTENNAPSLAQAIDALLKDENKRFKMGLAGRKLIEEKYTKDIFCAQYKKLYEQH